MDIPDSGAIFTLGKSHLAENVQSYFFIKNDPVSRLTSGAAQSAVICESGRLFVWGENQFGQLGIGTNGTTEVVTKPTCVKSLKALGQKACDIAFGEGWSITLTHYNDIFFAGRNIFPEDSATFSHFSGTAQVAGEQFTTSRKPFRLEEFDGLLDSNKEEVFHKFSAGSDHFVVLTSQGRLFGWGANEARQLGLPDEIPLVPVEITIDGRIKDVTCGPQCTLLLTETNHLFLAGSLNEFQFPTFTELLVTPPGEQITFFYISKANEIFYVTKAGDIYKSSESLRNKKLIFQKFYDYDNEENGPAVKLMKGNLFFAALTRKNKFFTTFSESGHHLKTFREISKFRALRILDIAVGDRHVLVFGRPKTGKTPIILNPSTVLDRTYTTAPTLLNGNLKEALGGDIEEISGEVAPSETDKALANSNGFGAGTNVAAEEDINGNSGAQVNSSTSAENDEAKFQGESQNGAASNSQNDFTQANYDGLKNGDFETELEVEAAVALEDYASGSEEDQQKGLIEEGGNNFDPNRNKVESAGRETDANQLRGSTSNVQDEAAMEDNAIKIQEDAGKNGAESQMPDEGHKNEEDLEHAIEEIKEDSIQLTGKDKIVGSGTQNDMTVAPNQNDLKVRTGFQGGSAEVEEVSKDAESSSSRKTSAQSGRSVRSLHKSASPLKAETEGIEVTNEVVNSAENLQTFLTTAEFFDSPYKQRTPKSTSRSIKFDEKSLRSQKSQDRLVRPRTPYPESNKQATPQTVKRTPTQIDEDLDNTQERPQSSRRPSLNYRERGLPQERVDEIARNVAARSAKAVATERYLDLDDYAKEDEKLILEISTGDDLLDKTVLNEIRFINNGVDVTHKVEDSLAFAEELEDESVEEIHASDTQYYKEQPKSAEIRTPNSDSEKSPDELKVKTCEDDERTTASVNSNISGNVSEISDKIKEPPQVENESVDPKGPVDSGKKRVQQFITDIKNKGKDLTCRSNRSVQVEDEPPVYSAVDERYDNKTSKICTIL